MKNMRGLLALLLVFVMFAQISIMGVSAVTVNSDGQPVLYSKEYNSGKRDVIANTLNGTSAGSYYTGNYTYEKLSALNGDSLYNSLHNLMTNTHKTISSYDDCHNKADQTDCENENGRVSLIYTGYSATMDQWNGWNREHVWPKNLGKDSTTGGGADLHHIRPSDAVVNSTRSNNKYGYANGGSKVYGNNPAGGYLGGTLGAYFEPNDNVKGDVARICLYVYVRWGSDWGATSITKVFQSVDVLLEWCELDPVDTWELGRNEVVGKIQGNRNVFIDYPELAWNLFNKEVPANMPSPSAGNPDGVTSPTTESTAPTEDPTTAPTGPQVDPSVTGSATLSFDDKAYRVSQDSNQQVWNQNGITLTNDKSSSTTNVADYVKPVRFYAKSKLTVAASNMKQILFTCNSNTYASDLKGSIPSDSNYTVSISGNVVTVTFKEAVNNFVIDKLNAQVRMDSLTVKCEVTTPDNPGTDNPGTDNPGTDTPGTDNPGTDAPSIDTPVKEEPTGFMAWLLKIINAFLALFGVKMVI